MSRGEEERVQTPVRELLEDAGLRPPVPEEDLRAIKAAFRARWQEQISTKPVVPFPAPEPKRPGRTPLLKVMALAASLTLVVALGWWWVRILDETRPGGTASNPDAPSPVLASLEAAAGAVTVGGLATEVGGHLAAGAEIEIPAATADTPAFATLRLGAEGGEGVSVRFAADTRAQLLSPGRLHLERGAVYIDTGPAKDSLSDTTAITVETAFGAATDIGTQFEVRLEPASADAQAALQIRVREGSVRLQPTGPHPAAILTTAGEALTLAADGTVSRAALAPHAEAWHWVLGTAGPFALEGRSLAELVTWVERESGRDIRFADPSLATAAEGIALHGTLRDLPPAEALKLSLRGAGLDLILSEAADGTWILRPGKA